MWLLIESCISAKIKIQAITKRMYGMKPIIGILAEIDNERTVSVLYPYTSAIEKSGGLPLIIPFTIKSDIIDEYTALLDGFLFTGGTDIDPLYYGEEAIPECGELHPYRDSLEFLVFGEAMRLGKPIMAICRGAELVNVALGGTLYQDIGSEYETSIAHRQTEPKFSHSHKINVVEGTPLSDLFPEARVKVNSFHHQAIRALGHGLKPMAVADDGIVEAMYYLGDNYLRAYQWHPERLYGADNYNKKLFDDFILACEKYKKGGLI